MQFSRPYAVVLSEKEQFPIFVSSNARWERTGKLSDKLHINYFILN